MNASHLRAELERRSARDQEARRAVEGWSDDPSTELWKLVSEVDADNTAWLVAIVTQHGWPGLSEVGEEAAVAAWLLAQHADGEPESQRFFHRSMGEAVDAGGGLAAALRLPGRPCPNQQWSATALRNAVR